MADERRPLVVSVLVAAGVVTAALLVIVAFSTSAWDILGIGRGVVAPGAYAVSGFVVVLAMTFGHAAIWAAATAVLYFLFTGFRLAERAVAGKVAASIAYVVTVWLVLLVYHLAFGEPLLGLERQGLEATLLGDAPDAHWLLVSAHPIVDWSVIPLGLLFLGLLWRGDTECRRVGVTTIAAVALLASSLAAVLSLAIHSTLAHVRI